MMLKLEEAVGVLVKLVIIGEFLIHKVNLPIQPFFEPMVMQEWCSSHSFPSTVWELVS